MFKELLSNPKLNLETAPTLDNYIVQGSPADVALTKFPVSCHRLPTEPFETDKNDHFFSMCEGDAVSL